MLNNHIEAFKNEWNQQARSTENKNLQVCRTVDSTEYQSFLENIRNNLIIDSVYEKILDVGCGNGVVLNYFKNDFKELHGIDFSQSMIAITQNHCIGTFLVAEAAYIPYPDNYFDRVLSNSIFHYFPDKNYALQTIFEMIRVCKPGGIILIGDLLIKEKELQIKKGSDLNYEKLIPHILRYSQWLFINLHSIVNILQSRKLNAEILEQPKCFKLSHYRKDMRIWV